MTKITIGILLGVCAGILDLIPMLIQKLNWIADLSAFTMWVVIGFLLSVTKLEINGILKGILISVLVLLPSAIIIGEKDIKSLISIGIMTTVLGAALGFVTELLKRRKENRPSKAMLN